MRLIKVIIFVILLGSSLCLNLRGEVVDQIVAVVNKDIITESEIEEALIPLEAQYRQTITSQRELKQKLKEARKLVLEQLIEEKLLLQKAQEEKIELYDSEVERMIDEIKARFTDEDKFNEWLKTQKLTLPLFKERVTEQAIVRKVINQKLRPEIKVSPEEVKDFYESNKEKFAEGSQVSLSYILIKGSPERENSESENLIRRVWDEIKAGVDFDQLVQRYSDGPKVNSGGFINLQSLPPELREIVERLKVGQTSEIIRSPAGFNIIKLTGKKEARARDFSEVKDLIEEQIFIKKLEERYTSWIEEIKKEAFIERK